ncbi:MAG TPA: SDR family oxidoreductase [Rhizomicrobium sp.]|jgi:short-subunit dehydrogenase|nr:SDR family oxidoreductase [Rhizomicrobium sp.]
MKTSHRTHPVVVITGASAGVGRAVARRFARAGAKLGLIARDEEALQEMRRDLTGAASFAYRPLDVSNAQDVFAAADAFERDLGPIDIWVNDAMVTVFSPVHEMTPEEFHRVTEVTYLGVVHGCMAALKHMRARNNGHIINIGSALAYRGIPLQSAYCGAKHAIRGFTAALRSELEHEKSGIALTMVQLPAMNTPQFNWARTHMPDEPRPMGTIYQPEAAAEAVFQATHTRPKEYWVGLSTFMTVIGNMVAPALMDKFLARTAVKGQETSVPVQPERKDNLFDPVTPLHRTHGSFGRRAKPKAFFADGQALRAAVVMAGAAVFFVLGRIIP